MSFALKQRDLCITEESGSSSRMASSFITQAGNLVDGEFAGTVLHRILAKAVVGIILGTRPVDEDHLSC